MIGSAIIVLEDLGVRFGERPILDRLTARLSGRAIGLLGPNGAGKTTLIHTLLGFHRPSVGSAQVLGHDVWRDARAVRTGVGYMPERESFVGDMSAVRFVRLMAELGGLPPAAALERAHEALFYVGLGEARYRTLNTYSLGMRQQVKLAQAIAHGPRLLFLDEPTNGLDPPARQRMLDLICAIRDAGETAIVLSSHLLRDVEAVCDEVLILKSGRIAAQVDLAAERRGSRRFLDVEVDGAREAFVTAAEALGCTAEPGARGHLRLIVPDTVDVPELYRAAAARGASIRALAQRRDSLEDLFFRAMEGADDRP